MKRLVWLASICSIFGLVILVCALTTPLESQAQGDDWVWANYTHDRDVWALAPRGKVLWAGTWGGLLRWDLIDGSYTKYTPADGLTGTVVWDIAVDGQGRAWVGHDRGLSVCDDTACTTYDKYNSGIPGEEVKEVVVAGDGRVWLASRDTGGVGEGVTVYNGATWTNYTTSDGLADNDVRSMAEDLNGHLWFGHWDGDVSEFDGVSTWTIHLNIDLNHSEVYGIAVDNLNRKWFITLRVLVLFDGTNWWRYYPPLEPPGSCPYLADIAVDGEGHPWIASGTGLWTFDGANWTRYHEGNSGLLDDSMKAVAAEGEKVWVGYADSPQADGLTQFDGSDWTHYDTVDSLPPNTAMMGAAVDHESRVWFGASVGAASFDCMTWTKYESSNTGGVLSDTSYKIIKIDHDGHIWFAGGIAAGGLVEFDGDDTWIQHSGDFPKPLGWVEAVAVDEDNHIWVGSRYPSTTWRGLSEFNGSSWTIHDLSLSTCVPSNVVESIAIDGDGNKWLGCETRFVDASDCTTYGSVDLAIQAYYTDIVGTVSEDPSCWVADPARNLVWVGRGTAGVSAYDGESWTNYSCSDMEFPTVPLVTWTASLAGLDAGGDLWARVLYDLTEGGATRFDGSWTPYTRAEGVTEVPYDMAVDDYGRVWFTSQRGVNMFYDPSQATDATVTVAPVSDGRLTSIDCSTCVTIPAGAVAQDTVVTYTPITPSATGALGHIGHFFDLSAVISGTTTPVTSFSPPYTITMSYAGENTETVLDDTLGLYWWQGGQWVLEPTSSVDTTNYRVTATPNHMTLFSALGEEWRRVYVPLVLKRY